MIISLSLNSVPSNVNVFTEIDYAMNTALCLLCKRENNNPYLTVGRFSIVKCKCGFIYTNPQPTQAELAALYSEDYAPYLQKVGSTANQEELWLAAHSAWYFRVLRRIKRSLFKKKTLPDRVPDTSHKVVLDFGYGNGRYLIRTKEEHPRWTLYGYDIDPRPLEGVTTLADFRELGKIFDLINMSHVLEHLPNPKETLEQLRSVLKDDGEIVIEVPNIGSWKFRVFGKHFGGLCLPHHLSHFSPETLTRLVVQAGYAIKSLVVFGSTKTTVRSIYSFLNINKPVSPYLVLSADYLTKMFGEKRINSDLLKITATPSVKTHG